MKLIAKGGYKRRKHAHVFGDERQFAELALYRSEEIAARALPPFAGLRSSCARRYAPSPCISAEMVQANHVHMR